MKVAGETAGLDTNRVGPVFAPGLKGRGQIYISGLRAAGMSPLGPTGQAQQATWRLADQPERQVSRGLPLQRLRLPVGQADRR